MNESLAGKLDALRAALREKGCVLVALSGGVDSALCMTVAHDVLGFDHALCVTIRSETAPPAEFEAACALAREMGWNHRTVEYSELDIPGYAENPVNRCYFCKREMFGRLGALARELGCACVVEGSNHDDRGDWRPGMKASEEAGAFAPLMECGIGKAEIRELAREFGLPNWDKPSGACLSSRFPYGLRITREGLDRVAAAERHLRSLGFRQVRVRHHDALARIELPAADIPRVLETSLLPGIVARFREIGYAYVTLDLEGYRTGSMNETLPGRGSHG